MAIKHLLYLTLPFAVIAYSAHGAESKNGFVANLHVGIEHDSNLFKQATDEQADQRMFIKPQLGAVGLWGKHQFTAGYEGETNRYADRDTLDHSNHKLKLKGTLEHSYQLHSELTAGYSTTHELPGTTDRTGYVTNEFNQVERKGIEGKISLGRKNSIGQLVFKVGRQSYAYSNNQQSYRDNDQARFSTAFFYRVAPKSRAFIEASQVNYDYTPEQNSFDLSSRQKFLLLGYEWKFTGKTTGTFKAGYLNKEYDDAQRKGIDGLSFELDMNWRPNTYTIIDLTASRQTSESALKDTGSFISTSVQARLKHSFTQRTHLATLFNYGVDDLVYRTDQTYKRLKGHIGLEHELKNWLTLGLTYKKQRRSDNLAVADYDADLVMLHLETTFK